MRIGLIIYDSLETISGSYLYDQQLVKHLEDCGDEVEVISIPWGPLRHTIPQNWLDSLYQKLISTPYDIVLQDEINHPSLFYMNKRIRSKVDYPIISIVHHLRSMEHHSRLRMPVYKWVEKQYLQSVDGFVFNSKATCEAVKLVTNDDKQTYIVATPAGNRFDELPEIRDKREKTDLRILFVGDVIQRKCLHDLLDAVAYIDIPFEIQIVGRTEIDKAYYEKLCQRIDSYHLHDRVTFTGCVSNEELVYQYEWADVLVVPSSYEGFGTVFIEAFKFGVPVIATKTGGIHEVVEHCKSGFLVERGDIYEIGGHLTRLYMDRNLLARMSENAQKRFLEFPSWATSMSRVRSFLERITSVQTLQSFQQSVQRAE